MIHIRPGTDSAIVAFATRSDNVIVIGDEWADPIANSLEPAARTWEHGKPSTEPGSR